MTSEQIQHIVRTCDEAFQDFITQAKATHALVVLFPGGVSLEDRVRLIEQRCRESNAYLAYMKAEAKLFNIMFKGYGLEDAAIP